MTNNAMLSAHPRRSPVTALLHAYVLLAVATLALLAILAAVAPAQAPTDAWVHASIVLALALLLRLRWHRALGGSDRAQRAVLVITVVLLVANAVEAAVPGLFPVWMRVESAAVVLLMAVTAVAVRRWGSGRR